MRIHLPRKKRNDKPIILVGHLREVWKVKEDLWQIKITTDYSNIDNLYLSLDNDEIKALKEEIEREEMK